MNVCAHLTMTGEWKAMRWRFYLWDKFQFKLKRHNFNAAPIYRGKLFLSYRLIAHIHIYIWYISTSIGCTSNRIQFKTSGCAINSHGRKHETKVETAVRTYKRTSIVSCNCVSTFEWEPLGKLEHCVHFQCSMEHRRQMFFCCLRFGGADMVGIVSVFIDAAVAEC